MKRGLLKNFLALMIVFGMLSACNLDYFRDAEFGDFVWDPSLAVPIGEISYSIEELFDELNDAGASVGTNNDNIVTLSYTEALQSQTASAFLAVLDQSFASGIQSGVDINSPGVSSTIDVQETFEYDLSQRSGELYDSIFFSGGDFDVSFASQLGADVDFTMTVNSLRERSTGNPLVITGSLTQGSPNFNANNSLADFDGIFVEDALGNATSNKVLVEMAYTINVTPTTVISSTDRVNFTIGLTNAEFQTVYGDVGTGGLDVNFQVVNLDFFRNFDATGIRFSEPVFSFVFDNGFGFPLGIDFRNISSIGSEGQIVDLTGTAIDNPTIVAAPTTENVGGVVQSTLELNSTNSNIADLLAVQPRKVIMEVNAESNPTGTNQYNFVDVNSLLDVSVNVDIPLIMNVDNLIAEEFMDFDNGGDLEEARRLVFRVIADNELPIGGDIELEFQDAQGAVVHTVSERPVFSGAPVGSDGRTTEATVTTADIEFSNEEIRAIEGATRVRIIARLATTNATSGDVVRFFSDYELKLRLAAQADVEIGVSGN